jgi:hypothetical protein
MMQIEEINSDQAEILCRKITEDLPEYFGIPSANEQYLKGVYSCTNIAVKNDNQLLGLIVFFDSPSAACVGEEGMPPG